MHLRLIFFLSTQEREKYGQMVNRFQNQIAEYQVNLQGEIEQRQKMQVGIWSCFYSLQKKLHPLPSPPFIYFLPISPLPSFPTLLILESVKFFVICFIPVNRGYIKTRAPGTLMGRLQDLAWWFSPFLTSRINSRAPNPDDFPCKTLMKPYPS